MAKYRLVQGEWIAPDGTVHTQGDVVESLERLDETHPDQFVREKASGGFGSVD